MSKIPFVEQSLLQLRLSLLDGGVDDALFRVMDRKKVTLLHGFELEMVILAESHFVTLYHKNKALFSELFACQNHYKEHE
jgi:hypothetical protein